MLLLLGASLATAAPAAAIDDPTRPDARVTHGPSCNPGGLVVEVVAGTSPYAVRLATTRASTGEDEAVLEPGETVVLRSGDVAHGGTIDGRLEYSARDGSGTAYTDELEEYTFTRPTQEDCAALAAPTAPEPAPPTAASPTPAAGGSTPSGGAGQAPSGPAAPTPAPTGEPRGSDPAVPAPAGESQVRQVSAGNTVTLQAGGFLPGETVTVRLDDGGDVLATAVAGPDGTVAAQVRIPGRTAVGRTTLNLVGADSAMVAGVELQVAAAGRAMAADDWTDLVPLTAAAVTLVGAVAGLVSVAGHRRTAGRRHATIRSA